MKRNMVRTAMETAGSLSAMAEHIDAAIDAGTGLSLRAQKLIAEGMRLQAAMLRSTAQAVGAPAVETPTPPDMRARQAIDAIRLRGQAPTVRTVAAEARCGWATAKRALQAWRGGNATGRAQALRGKESAQGA